MGAVERIAIVGGRGASTTLDRFGDRVVLYGSRGDAGTGPARRLEAALRTGTYKLVVVLARWIGHSTFEQVRRACRASGTRLIVWPNGLSSLAQHLAMF